MRVLLYIGLVALYLLHNDWWLWDRDGRLLGLPVGLTYHLLFCFAVVGVMALLVRHAWPLGGDARAETDAEEARQ